jgi:hypothetical protein
MLRGGIGRDILEWGDIRRCPRRSFPDRDPFPQRGTPFVPNQGVARPMLEAARPVEPLPEAELSRTERQAIHLGGLTDASDAA